MVTHHVGKRGVQGSQNILRIVMLERVVLAPMNIDEERQDLAECQGRLARPWALARAQQATGIDGLQGLADIVTIAEESKQLVHRGSWMRWSGCVAESTQHTRAFCVFKS